MDNDPAPTLALAALREVDSDNRTRLEDRCTELLATLMVLHEEILEAVTRLFDVPTDPETQLHPQTQARTGKGRQHVDLQISRVDESSTGPVAWIEVKVFSPESGPSQFEDYTCAATAKGVNFHVLCHEVWRTQLTAKHPDLKIRTWDELVEALRDVAGLPHGPITDASLEQDDLQLASDVAQFLYYLQQERVANVAVQLTKDSLDHFHRWQISLWSIYDLWNRVFEEVASDFGKTRWISAQIRPQRNNPFNHRRLAPETNSDDWIEWWWGTFYPAGSESWSVELSLASQAFWTDPPIEQPVLAWGITQHVVDGGIEAALSAIVDRFDELSPVLVKNDDCASRWYGAIPLEPVVGLTPDEQFGHLVREVKENRLDRLRDELTKAGLV
jgi:hypothetical protein